jgi:hydrogenase maturation protease
MAPFPVSAAVSRTLVLGLGNTSLSDDGAGVRLLEHLQRSTGPDAADFIDGGTQSFGLLSHVEAAGSLLVIDAANLHRDPGATALFEDAAMDAYLADHRRRTVREIGLIDLLEIARLLKCLPPRRALLCIQPERIELCKALSPRVEEAMPRAARLGADLLARWRSSWPHAR